MITTQKPIPPFFVDCIGNRKSYPQLIPSIEEFFLWMVVYSLIYVDPEGKVRGSLGGVDPLAFVRIDFESR